VRLVELLPGHCRWPVNDAPRGEKNLFLFCARPTETAGPVYCRVAALFTAYSALHWLAVLPVAAAWVDVGLEEPSAFLGPVRVLQYCRNWGQVIPIVFPHFSRVLQSLRQCSSIGYAPIDDDVRRPTMIQRLQR
jgi:hypothetical protein